MNLFIEVSGDLSVESYEVQISDDMLIETIVFDVASSGEYRMLYRFWDDEVTYQTNLSSAHLKVVGVQSDYLSYVRDYKDDVYSPDSLSSSEMAFIDLMAEKNEIGMYNPSW